MTTSHHKAQFAPPSGATGNQPVQVGEVQGDAHVLVLREMRARLTDAGSPARTAALDAAIAALAASQPAAQEVAVWVSPEQLEAHADPQRGEGGHYLPARKSGAGKLTQPLYRATPAQGIDLEPIRELLERRRRHWKTHLPKDPNAPGTRAIRTIVPPHGIEGETDYNNDVALYREGIAVMDEALALIDGQRDAAPGVGNG